MNAFRPGSIPSKDLCSDNLCCKEYLQAQSDEPITNVKEITLLMLIPIRDAAVKLLETALIAIPHLCVHYNNS